MDGAHERNTNFIRKLVKVHGETRREATCRSCGDPVQWFRTVTRQRWVLFDGDVRVGKDRTVDGQHFLYLDHKGIHWNHCKPLEARA